MGNSNALQNLLNRIASSEEVINLLKQALVNRDIPIGGNVNLSQLAD